MIMEAEKHSRGKTHAVNFMVFSYDYNSSEFVICMLHVFECVTYMLELDTKIFIYWGLVFWMDILGYNFSPNEEILTFFFL